MKRTISVILLATLLLSASCGSKPSDDTKDTSLLTFFCKSP